MNEPTPATPHPADELLRVAETVHSGEVSIAFKSGPTVLAKRGAKLLDIAEASQVPMESGCRMGMCGSDAVRILEGEENLSAMRSAERRTLERLGLGAGCRMACVSRVQGPVVVDPSPALAAPSESEGDQPQRLVIAVEEALQQTIRRVVVVGAGVAGVTAAERLPSSPTGVVCRTTGWSLLQAHARSSHRSTVSPRRAASCFGRLTTLFRSSSTSAGADAGRQ